MKNRLIKSFIVFNFLNLWFMNTTLAMESPPLDNCPEMKLASLTITDQHHTDAITDNANELTQEIKVRGKACLTEIKRGNNAPTQEKKAHYYEWARILSSSLLEICKFYNQQDRYQCLDNGLGVYTLLQVSTSLGRGLTQNIDLKYLTPSLTAQIYNTFLSLLEIDLFVSENYIDLLLNNDSNPLRTIDPDAAHYRLLSHLATLFVHFNDRIALQQKDKYLSYAYDCFEKMTSEEWKTEAQKRLDVIYHKQDHVPSSNVVPDMSMDISTKSSRKPASTYIPTRSYNPSNDFFEAIKLKNQFFAKLKSTKDKTIYGEPEKNAWCAILDIEAKIAQKLGIVSQPHKRTLEDYEKIYKELSSFCTPEKVNEHLPGFIIIIQNYGDHEGGEFRRTAIKNIGNRIEKAGERRRQKFGINGLSSLNVGNQQTKEEQEFQFNPLSNSPHRHQPSQTFWMTTYAMPPRPIDLSCKDNVTAGNTMKAPTPIEQKELKPTNREEKKLAITEPTFPMLDEVEKNTAG